MKNGAEAEQGGRAERKGGDYEGETGGRIASALGGSQ